MTALLKKLARKASEYTRNEKGNFAVIASITLLVMVMAAGSAIDVMRVHKDKQLAQSIADAVSLRSAVYVSTHNSIPQSSDDGFVHEQVYKASDAGFTPESTTDMTFKVSYDRNVKKEAEVVLSVTTKMAFMHMFGHDKVSYDIRSTSKFKEVDLKDPASIALIFDNSGSMWFDDKQAIVTQESYNYYCGSYFYPSICTGMRDVYTRPSGATKRIDALKTAAKSFLSELDTIQTEHQNLTGSTTRYVRTGLMAFNSINIAQFEVPMHWGILTDAKIDAMSPEGATNTYPSINKAISWMAQEGPYHAAENGDSTPLKYVVLLTDGMNTVGTWTWEAKDGTNYWRRWYSQRRCSFFGCWTDTGYTYETGTEIGDDTFPPDNDHNWEEGRRMLSSDVNTLADCANLKAAGVEVFTIGFALDAGVYYTNDWQHLPTGGGPYSSVDEDVKAAANALLSECASKPEYFMEASTQEELSAAFDLIGENIVTEVIRLSN